MLVKSADAVSREFLGVALDVLSIGEHMMVTRMHYKEGHHVPAHQHPKHNAGY